MIFLLPIFRLVSFLFILLNAREGATFSLITSICISPQRWALRGGYAARLDAALLLNTFTIGERVRIPSAPRIISKHSINN